MILTKVSKALSVLTSSTASTLFAVIALSTMATVTTTVAFADDSAQKAHLMNNIDIFGKTDLQAIYILMPTGINDEDIQGSLITRDFSRDPFFMQNIDREEFEMKVTLREINGGDEEKKKEAER